MEYKGFLMAALLFAAPRVWATLSAQTAAQNESIPYGTLHTLAVGDPGSFIYGDADNFYRHDPLAVRMTDNCFYLFDQDGKLRALYDLAAGKLLDPPSARGGGSPCVNETSARMRLPSRPEEIMLSLRDEAEAAYQAAVGASSSVESRKSLDRIKAAALKANRISNFIGSRKSVYVNADQTLALAKRLESLAENSAPSDRGRAGLRKAGPNPFSASSGKSGAPDSEAAGGSGADIVQTQDASRGTPLGQENAIVEAAIAGLDSLPSVVKLSRHYGAMKAAPERISATPGAAEAYRSSIQPGSPCDKRDQLVNFDNADTGLSDCLKHPAPGDQ